MPSSYNFAGVPFQRITFSVILISIVAAGIAGPHHAAACSAGAALVAGLGQPAGALDTGINRMVVLARRHAALCPRWAGHG